jgi:hypothetical protein
MLVGMRTLRAALPTEDGRTVMLSRYTQPEKELQMLIEAHSLFQRKDTSYLRS